MAMALQVGNDLPLPDYVLFGLGDVPFGLGQVLLPKPPIDHDQDASRSTKRLRCQASRPNCSAAASSAALASGASTLPRYSRRRLRMSDARQRRGRGLVSLDALLMRDRSRPPPRASNRGPGNNRDPAQSIGPNENPGACRGHVAGVALGVRCPALR